MRIKDLATRATKLLTGSAYMVFDNGTKVEKVDYAELAKQIITEYNTQTLAGSAQSVKSALDALNSNQTIKRGDTITFGGTNSMYAGRIGWNGLQIWFSVPMDKPAQESIYFTPSEIGGGNIYCCTANAAQALDRNLISKIEMRMANGSPYISVCLTLSSNPFSVSDAVMNVMFSESQSITIP